MATSTLVSLSDDLARLTARAREHGFRCLFAVVPDRGGLDRDNWTTALDERARAHPLTAVLNKPYDIAQLQAAIDKIAGSA